MLNLVNRGRLRALAASANVVSAVGVGLFQVKDALIHLAASNSQILSQLVLEQAFLGLLVISVGLVPVSGFLWLASMAPDIANIIKNETALGFECRPARGSDLKDLNALAIREFGERSSGYDNIMNIQAYSPECFWVVASERVAGYFGICSLTAAGERAIAGGYFSGANPAHEHVRKKVKSGKSVCIIGVVGDGTRGRGATVSALTTLVNSVGYVKVYGKPVSPDGLRLVKRFGMRDVIDGSEPRLERYCVLVRESPAPATL